ncbi:MAG: TolC family protein [Acidobacteriota bacterium]|nr:TolC family protein [Acidobacteriota bacterium]
MRSGFRLALVSMISLPVGAVYAGPPAYTIEDAVRLAQAQNTEIAIARKKLEATHGGVIEARAGYLPSVVSSGLYRKREQVANSRLRPDDYNASVRVVQNVYTGGATHAQLSIARLLSEKQQYDLQAVIDRVTMDVRTTFYELLLNREKIHVREQSVAVLQQELKSQRERLSAGTVGELNVRRAEVSLANEEPELIQAQTDLRNSHLKLSELFGVDWRASPENAQFETVGRLEYEPRHPDLNESLGRAAANRAEIRSAEIDVAIEEQQLTLDRSATRPRVEFFTGYEVYNERDPTLGREFNHGYVIGLNGSWPLFDGYATRGRMEATRARRDAAVRALEAIKLTVASEVRSAFLDLQQADRVLEAQTKNLQTADESLEISKGNLAAGLGTQLDILQAASDVTRTRTTRLSAIYLHNAALVRLDRACGGDPETLAFQQKVLRASDQNSEKARGQIFQLARPPSALPKRK